MRRSETITKTRRQAPADEESLNAQLLIRAGYVHKAMAGVYSYLPMGKKVLDNISAIVREEMNKVGGEEVLMNVLQPKELWQKTNRWDDAVVDNWFKTKLANGTEVGVGLSHEEPVVDAMSNFVYSYKDLPVYVYQIQTKFRNELRAKSGLLRGREFLMKDMYSLSRSQTEHDEFYEKVTAAYMRIFSRLGIGDITYPTYASGGYFTGFSREFQTISHIGEDTVYLDKEKGFAINKEIYEFRILEQLGTTKEQLTEQKAVEVGNIFPLGTKYTDALGVHFTDEQGQQKPVIMGSYGIGISRLMGLLAEHFSDDKGLSWPTGIAPYQVYLAPIGDSSQITASSDEIYKILTEAGTTVLYDDRDERAGEKFADADLMGIPARLVISDKTLAAGGYELKYRRQADAKIVNKDSLATGLVDTLKN